MNRPSPGFAVIILLFLPLLFFQFIVVQTLCASNVDFRGNVYLRFDSGDEVNTQSSLSFPDNLIQRNYIEGLMTAEALFKKIPFGKRLRVGLRLLELQASDYDIDYTSLDDARRFDDKIYAQWTSRNWEVWGGDVTETFGKGVALSLYENRDLYFNSGLRGGKVAYRSKKIRMKAIYGRSRAWYDVLEENVGGFNLEIRPQRGILFGGSLVHQEGISYEKRFTPGVYAGIGIGPVNLYGEYAQRRPDDGDVKTGDGAYLSADFSMLGLAIQAGYKYYNFGVENPFQTPPVAQREITTHLLIKHPHVPLMNDQVGFELNLSASPSDVLFLDLNFSRSSRHDGGSLLPTLKQEDWAFWELFFEGELTFTESTLKLGFGRNAEAYPTFWEEKTGLAIEETYSVTALWSLTLNLENMWVSDKENDSNHTDQWGAVTVSRASIGSLNLSIERSSVYSETEGDFWAGGEISADLGRSQRLMLFYGRERGGLKCSSGVCRTVQAFDGFRLTYEGRF